MWEVVVGPCSRVTVPPLRVIRRRDAIFNKYSLSIARALAIRSSVRTELSRTKVKYLLSTIKHKTRYRETEHPPLYQVGQLDSHRVIKTRAFRQTQRPSQTRRVKLRSLLIHSSRWVTSWQALLSK